MNVNSKKSKVFQAVLCCLIWSTAIPVLKISYSELNLSSGDVYQRILFAGMRFMISAVILFIYFIIKNKALPRIKPNIIVSVVIFGIVNTTLQYLCFYTGVINTAAIKATLLDSLKPLLVVLLAHFLKTDDRINVKKLAGLFFGFLGIILANIDEFTSGQFSLSMSFRGEGMLFLASLAYAYAVIFGKKIMKCVHFLPLNIYQFFIGASILLAIGLTGTKGYSLNFTSLATILLVYLGLISAVVFVIWYRLLSKYQPSSITIFVFLIPVFGSIISSILFVESTITISVILSLILLTIGIVLVNYNKKNIKNET